MEDFRIIQPSPLLAPYVKNYWLLKTACDCFPAISPHRQPADCEHRSVSSSACGDPDPATRVRTVPTGMMNLIFHRGNRLLSVHDNELHPRAFLSGQEKRFADLEYAGEINMISVVFRPAGVRAFFDLPANMIHNLRVTAGDLEDKELAELENSVLKTENDGFCIMLIEQFLLKRLTRIAEYKLKRIDAAIGMINYGQTDIARLADVACLSTKQFQRVFSEYVGSNPKEFSRTIRFQRALHILETSPETTLVALAADCGYFDQSHLIKEFKALSGYTPREYLEVCPPHSDYFA